jgi:hypothetical protein
VAELNDDDLKMLRETFGMTQRLDQKMDDHLEWSKSMSGKRDAQLKELDDRLKPVEELHGDIKRAMKVSAYIGLPTTAAFGAVFWESFKAAVKKMLAPH